MENGRLHRTCEPKAYSGGLDEADNEVDNGFLCKVLQNEMRILLTPQEIESLNLLYLEDLPAGITASLVGILSGESLDEAKIGELEKSALAKLRKSQALKAFFEESE